MLFEKITCHRPKAFAGAEVYFVRNPVDPTADLRCGLREWPVLPLRGGTYFLAHAAFPPLRAHAAQNADSHIGLFFLFRCDKHEGLVREAKLLERSRAGKAYYVIMASWPDVRSATNWDTQTMTKTYRSALTFAQARLWRPIFCSAIKKSLGVNAAGTATPNQGFDDISAALMAHAYTPAPK